MRDRRGRDVGAYECRAPMNTARLRIPRTYSDRAPVNIARLWIPRAPIYTARLRTPARLFILRAYSDRLPTNARAPVNTARL